MRGECVGYGLGMLIAAVAFSSAIRFFPQGKQEQGQARMERDGEQIAAEKEKIEAGRTTASRGPAFRTMAFGRGPFSPLRAYHAGGSREPARAFRSGVFRLPHGRSLRAGSSAGGREAVPQNRQQLAQCLEKRVSSAPAARKGRAGSSERRQKAPPYGGDVAPQLAAALADDHFEIVSFVRRRSRRFMASFTPDSSSIILRQKA